jgi:hypothetical protein
MELRYKCNFLITILKKIFEVKENKDHTFKSIEKAILLRGEKGKAIDV